MNKTLEEIYLLKSSINFENFITTHEKEIIKKLLAKIKNNSTKAFEREKQKGKFYKNKTSHTLNNIDNIKNLLNKFTNETYTKILPEIITILKNNKNDDFINNTISLILNTSISNKIYIELYFNLLNKIIQELDLNNEVIIKNLNELKQKFHTYNYINPDDNYDDFCKINLENNCRKNLIFLLFYFIRGNFLELQFIEDIINSSILSFNNLILKKENKEIVNEITEVIYLLIYNYYSLNEYNTSYLKKILSDFESVIDEENINNYPGLSNKAIFKIEDLINDIEI